MRKFRLSVVTENQKNLDKGKKLALLLCETLNCSDGYEISKYHKFENSFRIEIIGQIKNENDLISESIELTDRICSPWIVTYNRDNNDVELLFNKSDYSNFRRNDFNVLNWAQFELENE